jgi:hypothetical protein
MDTTVEDQIRQRAYEIWDREGRPDGKQEEHWTQACQEIAAATGVKTDCSQRPVAFAESDVDAIGDDKPAHQVLTLTHISLEQLRSSYSSQIWRLTGAEQEGWDVGRCALLGRDTVRVG